MDPTKEPGIVFRGVYLTKLQFSLKDKTPETLDCSLNLSISKEIQGRKEGGKTLFLRLAADPMAGVKEKPFEMQVEILGVFDAEPDSNLPIETFGSEQGPALLVPYLRELISNITARTPLPPLILPPINVHALLSAKNEAPKQVEEPSKS